MSPMLWMQILAILVTIMAAGFTNLTMVGNMPFARLTLANVILSAFLVWWVGSIVWIRVHRRLSDDSVQAWYGHNLAVFWVGNAFTIAMIWLLMPFAGQAHRMAMVIFTLGPVAVEVMGTVRPSRFGKRGLLSALAPVAIPAGVIPFLVLYGGVFAWPVILFLIAHTAVLLMLRESTQNAVNKADAARARAEAERDARERFLASASHDLGQPLQSARLFFDQVVRASNPEQRAIAVVETKAAFATMARQLHLMIEHLQLETGMVMAKLRPLAAGPLISAVASLAEASANQSGVQIIALPSRLRFTGDPSLVERALSNLTDNAIRHAKAKRVLIGARRHGDNVRFWVIDDGAGIASADLPRLFEDFVQGSDHGDEVRGGFGLGLASVRRMAALMGGSAGTDIAWKKGAALFLELPGV